METLLGGHTTKRIIIIVIAIAIPILLWLSQSPKDILNKSICGRYTGSEKEECMEYAKCDSMADPRKKGECQCDTYHEPKDSEKKEGCYINLAEKFVEPLYCRDKVTNDGNDTFDKDHCYERVAKVGQDSSICAFIVGNSYKNECYAGTVSDKNPSVCENIHDPYYKNECYLKMTFDSKICEKFLPVNGRYEQRDTCYGNMAKQIKNESLCGKIIYPYGKELCQLDFHMGESISYCDGIKDNQAAWICYGAYVRKTGDYKVCNKITVGTGTARIDECYLQALGHEKYVNTTAERTNICRLIKDIELQKRCGL